MQRHINYFIYLLFLVLIAPTCVLSQEVDFDSINNARGSSGVVVRGNGFESESRDSINLYKKNESIEKAQRDRSSQTNSSIGSSNASDEGFVILETIRDDSFVVENKVRCTKGAYQGSVKSVCKWKKDAMWSSCTATYGADKGSIQRAAAYVCDL